MSRLPSLGAGARAHARTPLVRPALLHSHAWGCCDPEPRRRDIFGLDLSLYLHIWVPPSSFLDLSSRAAGDRGGALGEGPVCPAGALGNSLRSLWSTGACAGAEVTGRRKGSALVVGALPILQPHPVTVESMRQTHTHTHPTPTCLHLLNLDHGAELGRVGSTLVGFPETATLCLHIPRPAGWQGAASGRTRVFPLPGGYLSRGYRSCTQKAGPQPL